MKHTNKKFESLRNAFKLSGFDAKEQPMFLYCSLCSREIERSPSNHRIELVTIQHDDGSRNTGVICPECADIPPCERNYKTYQQHYVEILTAITINVEK